MTAMSVHTELSLSDAELPAMLADLREQVLERGEGLTEQQILAVLTSAGRAAAASCWSSPTTYG